MSANGAQQAVQGVGFVRLPGGFLLELGLAVEGEQLLPLCRLCQGGAASGTWIQLELFIAFGESAKAFRGLVESGLLVATDKKPDDGPPILDAGGAPLRPRLAP